MIVYHASTFIIENPDINHSREYLDFGKGFYLTTIFEQAEKYAMRFIRRGHKAYINEYQLDDNLPGYKKKTFERYDKEWLEYVGACRKGYEHTAYDVISGGIADDKVFNTVDLFFAGEINIEDALKRLIFEQPNHQICVLNQNVLCSHLHFLRAIEVKL